MLNAELIRINTLSKITLEGFMVKLSSSSKLPEEQWSRVMTMFKDKVAASMKNQAKASEIKVLQANSTDKCNFNLPPDDSFSSLTSLMQFCYDFCQECKSSEDIQLNYIVHRTNLEQTFLAYASHQRTNDKAV